MYFYLTVDFLTDTLRIHSNHNSPISLTLQSFDLSTETTAVQLEILEVSCMPHNKLNRVCARFWKTSPSTFLDNVLEMNSSKGEYYKNGQFF